LRSISFPIVTVALIVFNVVVYLLELTPQGQVAAASFAIVPSELFHVGIFGGPANGMRDTLPVPESYTLITYMFLHGDPFHLAGNMLFLWVFGDNIEDAMGHLKFLVFYLLCGICGGLTHAALMHAWNPGAAHVPLIGASGAVAGVIAAYLMLHPHVGLGPGLHHSFAHYRHVALGVWVLSQFIIVLIPNVGRWLGGRVAASSPAPCSYL
jgi:membrane associated rhomboid family serine protease